MSALPTSLKKIENTPFELGIVVHVLTDISDGLFGCIRWIGKPPNHDIFLVGVELEDRIPDLPMDVTDGRYHDVRLFNCEPGRGVFLRKEQIGRDCRFDEPVQRVYRGGGCPVVKGCISPMSK